ncbi:DUF6816 family protein [Microcoleus sp. FACHB-68]|uniref:DUF6816 family protein n=1 Tax=Microcoleus sp. FACHB-68 TaxID=2692826 RepID=UPI001689E4BC|nr:hypothetical protein [Microcoleus sp. FACHB-68]MBD1938908.1 hypothetical protein [Microcoleus sp. FACHB-68]
MRIIWNLCLILLLSFWGAAGATAGPLAERMAQFPDWQNKPPVRAAQGDLIYPGWMAGTWRVTSTLVDTVAPLAPALVTPGFEGNRQYLNQPVTFPVRFVGEISLKRRTLNATLFTPLFNTFVNKNLTLQPATTKGKSIKTGPVVADRAFNGLSIARAYLGESAVSSVKVDPDSPSRQITQLRGGSQLVSVVTGRGSETPAPDKFVATEVSQQVFRGGTTLYFNEVETTTFYQRQPSEMPVIQAQQVSAIYLSPQDPDYFAANGRPVALYRYDLELLPASE